jgi:hypothetical protein
MNAMKIMKIARAKEKADEGQMASIEGRTELANQMARVMIEDEEKGKAMKADAILRKQKAKKESKQKKITKKKEEANLLGKQAEENKIIPVGSE